MITGKHWFCVRTQPKRERIAYSQLCTLPGVNVSLPQVRYEKANRKRKRHVTEPIFPGYLFVNFDPELSSRAVNYTQGVAYIVRHGRELAIVPDILIQEIESIVPDDTGILSLSPEPFSIGETIHIINGIFESTDGKVQNLVSAEKRIDVLLDILGQETLVSLPEEELKKNIEEPLQLSK